MNPRNLTLVAAALIAAGAALAQSPQPLTRAEVHAQAIAANEAGTIRVDDTAVLRAQLSAAPSQRSRAEVHAEAVAANKARAGTSTYADSALLDRMLSTPSTLSRDQVRAEAIEARRQKVMAYGERDRPADVTRR
jgi:hypothetical protein